MGVLTKYLIGKCEQLQLIEIDKESIEFLVSAFPVLKINNRIHEADFLKIDITEVCRSPIVLIGNFPYNISSQIMFKVYEHREKFVQVVGMFQKEVAERIVAKPGNKIYGILSVLLQAYYDMEYLFTVEAHEFNPPPKVKSGVIRLTRNSTEKLDCNEKLFKTIIKTAFNQRRKTLRNSLKSLHNSQKLPEKYIQKRPEQLHYYEFVEITNALDNE